MERNRFEALRVPGIVGVNSSSDVETMSFGRGNYILLIREIQPGKWDYGYKDFINERTKMPGEGSGWFRSKHDAELFGLDLLRRMAMTSDVQDEIEATIYGMMQHTLDFG